MPRKQLNARHRRAAILMVVVVLLTLFLVIGLCFVLFADAQATSSRFYREANLNLYDKYPTPEELFGWSLGELIYDATDDTGATTPIRGHSLARNMYGWNYQLNAAGTDVDGINNVTPFNGTGRPSTGAGTYQNPYGIDDRLLLNYTYYASDNFKRDPERINAAATATGGGLYTGGWNPPYTMADLNSLFLADVQILNDGLMNVITPSFWRGDQVGFRHPTWPAPNPTLDPLNQAWTDPNPALGYLKYMTLRPRPVDQLMPSEIAAGATEAQVRTWATRPNNTIFPLPASATGDVRNLPGPGPQDSFWMDLGYPVIRLAASQRKVKPLFAFLVVDLDGRVNINMSGNVKESELVGYGYHGSNQGFGPWEINPRYLMPQTANPFGGAPFPAGGDSNEYLNLFRGTTNAAGTFGGRYGTHIFGQWDGRFPPPALPPAPVPPNQFFPFPNSPNNPSTVPDATPLNYAQADFNGSAVVSPQPPPPVPPPPASWQQPLRWTMPGAGALSYSTFPSFPGTYQNGSAEERYHHPALFNPFRLNHPSGAAFGGAVTNDELDRLLPIGDMQGLIGWVTPRLPASALTYPFAISPDTLNTEMAKIWPLAVTRYPRLRNLITTHGVDLDRAGAAPGQPMLPALPFASPTTSPYMLDGSLPPSVNRVPQGPPTFYSTANVAQSLLNARTAVGQPGGDLRNDDWRSGLADLGRVNLNRALHPFPTPTAAGFQVDTTNISQGLAQWRAQRDRVEMARDIFVRLQGATGAAPTSQFSPPIMTTDPAALPPNDPVRQQFEALRYLAQLAVNIVDFIDSDDVMTAFNFLGSQMPLEPVAGPTAQPTVPPWGWVFGTELPRLVLNEAYGQLQNDPNDTFGVAMPNLAFQRGGVSDPDTSATSAPMGMGRPFNTAMPIPPTAKAQLDYRVNFFVELHNPHNPDQFLSEQGAARLQLADPALGPGQRNVYKIVIRSQTDPAATRGTENVLGLPKPDPGAMFTPNIWLEVQDFEHRGQTPPPSVAAFDRNVVLPAQGNPPASWAGKDPRYGDQGLNNWSNNGYALLGPDQDPMAAGWQGEVPHDRDTGSGPDTPATAPIQPTISVRDQTIAGAAAPSRLWTTLTGSKTLDPAMITGAGLANYAPTIMLQRLAIPTLPAQPDPTKGNYNPYITVDYLEQIPIFDAVLYDGNGKRDGSTGSQRQPLTGRYSFGRRQPFKATQLTQQSPTAAPTDRIQQTFFRQNGQADTAAPGSTAASGTTLDVFTWLVHYDRKVTSPMDLLHVTALKPHELTHEFMNPANVANLLTAHQAPWRVPQTRLSRGLEMLGGGNWIDGGAFGARVPGKININTMADFEVFQALCDALAPPQQRHYFDQTTIATLWNTVRANRPFMGMGLPYMGTGPAVDNQYADFMRPPPYPAGNGPQRTMLQQSVVPPIAPTFGTGDPHPYNMEELLRKIMANVTTRSNTFAVYITTGFFEVRRPLTGTDPDGDATMPVKLGREVDTRLRHKFFAIVDRTNLSLDINNPRVQGARPIFFPLRPVDLSYPAGLQEPNVIMSGSLAAQTFVPAFTVQNGNELVIRDTIDHNGREYSGAPNYSGETASLFGGNIMFLDVGANQEKIRIEQVFAVPGDPSTSRIQFYAIDATGTRVPFQKNHARGAPICTMQLGNPGPQVLPIQYDEPPYSNTVVPFRAILQ